MDVVSGVDLGLGVGVMMVVVIMSSSSSVEVMVSKGGSVGCGLRGEEVVVESVLGMGMGVGVGIVLQYVLTSLVGSRRVFGLCPREDHRRRVSPFVV